MDIGSISNLIGQDQIGVAAASAKSGRAPSAPAQPTAVPKASAEGEGAGLGEVEQAVSNMREFVQTAQKGIDFSVDDSSGEVVVKVTDINSGDVIRQIPSEEALKLAENISEIRSLLFEAKA